MPLRRSQRNADKNSCIESIRSDANVLCQNQFIAISDRRMKSGKAQSLARMFNWTHEKNLQQRRERLRNLLATEAASCQHELINDSRIKAEESFKSKENRLLGLRAEREIQRLKFVEEMKIQQIINSCDEIRPYLRQKIQDEYKNCQQLQIVDNSLKKLEELDRDRLWHEVQTRVYDQMTQRDIEESSIARNRNLRDQQILRKQMSEKHEIREQLHEEEDTMHCGKVCGSEPSEEEILIENKKKQLRFAKDLLSQQAEKEQTKKNQKNCDILHELASIAISTQEMKMAERNARMEKKQNMKETLQFLGYKRSVEEDKTKVEREYDSLTEDVRNGKTSEYLKNRIYFEKQRNEFNKNIHDERWKQIMDRRRKLDEEKNEKINEIIQANEIFANNAHVESELLRKKKNFKLQYGNELRAQCNYEKLEKVKLATSSNAQYESFKKEETHKNELIKSNIGRIHQIYPMHPNYKAILNSEN